MKSPALTVVQGAGPNRLARAASAPRIRPGERPAAIDLELTSVELKTVRAAASEVGLGVDACVSILLEYQSLCDLGGYARVAALADAVRTSSCFDAVATIELQNWHRLITGRLEPPGDDLPTVFIPLRLVTALPMSTRAEAVKRTVLGGVGDIDRAVTLEAVATAHGMVMQTWVLSRFACISGGAAAAF